MFAITKKSCLRTKGKFQKYKKTKLFGRLLIWARHSVDCPFLRLIAMMISKTVIPPAPAPVRGQSFRLSYDPKRENIIYAHAKSIYMRSIHVSFINSFLIDALTFSFCLGSVNLFDLH